MPYIYDTAAVVDYVYDASVGVGPADFSSMEKLDGDEVRLVNRQGKRSARDMVQFVPMRDFAGKSSHMLAREVGSTMIFVKFVC